MTTPRSMTSGDKPGQRQPVRRALREDRSLLHEEGACLPLRSRHGRCHACADVCPVSAIEVSVASVSLSQACIGCGRCSAACPTEALTLPELLALPEPVAASLNALESAPACARPVRVECRMVPAELIDAGSIVVPCTGVCTPGRLMAQAASGRPVEVVDRGWCAGCPAAGGLLAESRATVHPAAAAIAAAAAWLDTVGDATPICLKADHLPAHLRPATLPLPPEQAPPLDRRRFFRAALDKPAGREPRPTPMGGDGRAAYPADRRQPSPERSRQHQALQLLAARHDRAVPAEFFASVHVDTRCCDKRLCAALCPTAALSVADDGGTALLRFDPVRCIACGNCERACPEGALALTPHGGIPALQTLATHLRQRCSECGDAYTAPLADAVDTPAGATTASADGAGGSFRRLCPTCIKSHRFMADARRQLFGALN